MTRRSHDPVFVTTHNQVPQICKVDGGNHFSRLCLDLRSVVFQKGLKRTCFGGNIQRSARCHEYIYNINNCIIIDNTPYRKHICIQRIMSRRVKSPAPIRYSFYKRWKHKSRSNLRELKHERTGRDRCRDRIW